ncbi:MAG: biotin/lipoyl-containing protein [Anaerolineaceae bacterium]|jgi:biotin carboxyl carrier protein|nr:biotin/lipoyl-containing protein [Anaerolineaceae bacterium]
MKIRVKVDNQTYEVDIPDLKCRPILAVIDGETFEVWPEDAQTAVSQNSLAPVSSAPVSSTPAVPVTAAAPVQGGARTVTAPIPGVILSLSVHEGDTIQNGQELLILEAMKMNNAIRASRDGKIARIHVHPGDQVKHGQPLMEFSD